MLRTSRVQIDGRISRLLFDYELTDGAGTHHSSEVHELGLFTPPELTETFIKAGFSVDFDHVGLTDRGCTSRPSPGADCYCQRGRITPCPDTLRTRRLPRFS